MNDLAAFVDARLTEDEKAARVGTLPEEVWGARGWYDPERVLAECRAKRGLVRYAAASLDESQGTDVLRLLALPWAGHSDYRADWTA
ncbi:DUF6221 family protein [Arthrobacter sp. MDT2-2]